MFFSCFCSNKKYIKENVITHCKLVKVDELLKLLNPISNEIIMQKEFPDTIITNCVCNCYGIKLLIISTKNVVYILDESNFKEIYSFTLEEEILSSCSEKNCNRFYIGCKSGRIIVYTAKFLNRFICNEIYNIYCFKPVYNIAIHVERNGENVKKQIYAGFSKWEDKPLQQVNIYNNDKLDKNFLCLSKD